MAVGLVLKNTHPVNGGVTRSIYRMDRQNNATGCGDQEHRKTTRWNGRQARCGCLCEIYLVSMNM